MRSVSIVVGMISVGAVLVIGASGCSADSTSPEKESEQGVQELPAISAPVLQQQDTCEQWGFECAANPSICKPYGIPPGCGPSRQQAMTACHIACPSGCVEVQGC